MSSGSRDPYMVTGTGAGFVMCWQNDVQLSIAEDKDPRNFMIVNSGSYVLAIPDLGHYARQEAEVEATGHAEGSLSIASYKQLAIFKKTIMKLNGNVRWVAGLVFERNVDEGGRSFSFIPHYDVVLKNPKYAKPSGGKVCYLYAMTGFLLTRNSSMMLSEDFEVTTSTCPSRLLPPMIENGRLRTLSRPRHTIASILLHASLHTSLTGGPCSQAPCLFQSDRARYGRALRNPARSLDDIWLRSSTISFSPRCT